MSPFCRVHFVFVRLTSCYLSVEVFVFVVIDLMSTRSIRDCNLSWPQLQAVEGFDAVVNTSRILQSLLRALRRVSLT